MGPECHTKQGSELHQTDHGLAGCGLCCIADSSQPEWPCLLLVSGGGWHDRSILGGTAHSPEPLVCQRGRHRVRRPGWSSHGRRGFAEREKKRVCFSIAATDD